MKLTGLSEFEYIKISVEETFHYLCCNLTIMTFSLVYFSLIQFSLV